MARHKPSWLVHTEYALTTSFALVLRIAPRSVAETLCSGVLTLLMVLVPKRRRMMRGQLELAFPEKQTSEISTLLQTSFRCLGRTLWFIARLRDVAREQAAPVIETVGFEHLRNALAKNQGVVVFTAHYGCWEAMAVQVAKEFPKVAVAARPLDNPKLDAWLNDIRECTGAGVIPRRQLLKEGMRSLRGNGILGILMDQNYTHGGLFVDFFGRPAATTSIVSLLARRTGAAVIPMHTRWTEGRLEIICEPELTLSTASNPALATAEDTQRMTRRIEDWIRRDPAQWLWLHNRWRRHPEPTDMIYRSTPGPERREAEAPSTPDRRIQKTIV